MDFDQVKKLAYAALFLPFAGIIERQRLHDHRVNQISQFANISIEEVEAFAKTQVISLDVTMEYAARYGKLPDAATVALIDRYGFSVWKRFLGKNDYVNNAK